MPRFRYKDALKSWPYPFQPKIALVFSKIKEKNPLQGWHLHVSIKIQVFSSDSGI